MDTRDQLLARSTARGSVWRRKVEGARFTYLPGLEDWSFQFEEIKVFVSPRVAIEEMRLDGANWERLS